MKQRRLFNGRPYWIFRSPSYAYWQPIFVFQLQNYGRPNKMVARIWIFLIFSWLFGAVSMQRLCLFVESDCCCHCRLLTGTADAFASTVARALLFVCFWRKLQKKKLLILCSYFGIIYFIREKITENSQKEKSIKFFVFAVVRILYWKVSTNAVCSSFSTVVRMDWYWRHGEFNYRHFVCAPDKRIGKYLKIENSLDAKWSHMKFRICFSDDFSPLDSFSAFNVCVQLISDSKDSILFPNKMFRAYISWNWQRVLC